MSNNFTSGQLRDILLKVLAEASRNSASDGTLQMANIYPRLKDHLRDRTDDLERRVLAEWQALINSGLIAWGINWNNDEPPFFHITDRGKKVLEQVSRDPSNTHGYMAFVNASAPINDVAKSYLRESLDCYRLGLHRSAAVMLGGTVESIILELRDAVVGKLNHLSIPVPKPMSGWQIKSILESLHSELAKRKADMPRDLRENFEAYFLAFPQPIRAARNEAGHPSSVDPVSEDSVHASLLLFPSLAKLAYELVDWSATGFK